MAAMSDREFDLVKKTLEKALALDLNGYKPAQMRRRLDTFIDRNGRLTPPVFCKRLAQDAEMLDALRDWITINVTEFFRDATQWTRFATTILPLIRENKSRPKIWSAGCSNGSEPYSIAMLLAEAGVAHPRILATDFDRRILDAARKAGPYAASGVRAMPTALRDTFMRADDRGDFWVIDTIKARVDFREMNLLRDRFDHGFDLIACRNVIIYFEDRVKDALLRHFTEALAPNGILFIGSTESILNAQAIGLERVGGDFYRRTAAAAQQDRTARGDRAA